MFKWLMIGGMVIYILAEISLVVEVGQILGLGGILIWTLGTAAVGVFLLRMEGVRGVVRIHRQLQQEVLPTKELVDMALIVSGGVLMVLPGILADFVGLIFLIQPSRWAVRGLFFLFITRWLDRKTAAFAAPARRVIHITPEQADS